MLATYCACASVKAVQSATNRHRSPTPTSQVRHNQMIEQSQLLTAAWQVGAVCPRWSARGGALDIMRRTDRGDAGRPELGTVDVSACTCSRDAICALMSAKPPRIWAMREMIIGGGDLASSRSLRCSSRWLSPSSRRLCTATHACCPSQFVTIATLSRVPRSNKAAQHEADEMMSKVWPVTPSVSTQLQKK